MSKTVALYGSAANPPHRGHLDAIEQCLAQVDEVRFLPSASHAFGKTMLPFAQRLAMARLLIESTYGTDGPVQVDDLEGHLAKPGQPVYSIDVLRSLHARRPDERLLLVIGPDNAAPEVWQRFREHEAIDREFGKLIVQQRLPIRSTEIRERLQESSDARELRPWLIQQVGEPVADYILHHQLYRNEQAGHS